MDLNIKVEQFESATDNGDNTVTLKKIDMVKFMEDILQDEKLNEFLNHSDIKDMFAHRIGTEGLLTSFTKEEVCEKLTWDFIKEYFLDHMNTEDILNKIGWETVKDHFADDISGVSSDAEDSDEPSLLDSAE